MTLAQVANPTKWSEPWRWVIGAAAALLLTIGSTAGTTGILIGRYGEEFKQFGRVLNEVVREQKQVRTDLGKAHDDTNKALTLASQTAESLKAGREANLPRIKALEDQAHALDSGLQVLNAKADNLTKSVEGIGKTVEGHGSELSETNGNLRILIDKLAPEASPRQNRYGPHGH